jgi:hypothetical protein
LAADYAQSVKDLRSCQSLTISSEGISLTFSLTQMNFGPAGSPAARMDGEYKGVQTNGYLATQLVHTAGLLFFYFQIGSGSSQEASSIYSQAVSKATSTLAAS